MGRDEGCARSSASLLLTTEALITDHVNEHLRYFVNVELEPAFTGELLGFLKRQTGS